MLLAAAAFAGVDRWEIFSREVSGDECLVGTWTEVSSTREFVLEAIVRMERSGAVRSFHPDGAGALDFGDGVVETGTYNDHSLTDTYSGKIEYRYEVDDGDVHMDITSVDITRRREVDGDLINERSLNSFSRSTAEDSFTCSEDRLVLEGETTPSTPERTGVDFRGGTAAADTVGWRYCRGAVSWGVPNRIGPEQRCGSTTHVVTNRSGYRG